MTLPARIVAAVTADLQPRLRAILPGYDVRFVRSGTELVRALDEAPCDLLIVEVHFNESAAAAALGCALGRGESFPAVCIRDVPSTKRAHAALNALRVALGAAGADAFIHLPDYPDDAAGNARVGAMLERLISLRHAAV